MYRDFVGKPEKIILNGTTWWYQEMLGTLVLYDCYGEPVGEFDSMDALEQFLDEFEF